MNEMTQIQKILIQKLRVEKIISQVELAKAMNVSNASVTKWLNGGSIELSKIPLLCECLKITPNELFDFANEHDISSKDYEILEKIKNNRCLLEVVERFK